MPEKSNAHWKILIGLALIGGIALLAADNALKVVFLMALAYFHNASYSMVSRSGVRDSALYHAFTILLSNVLFYSVLHQLVRSDLSIALFIPYTVATVWGSFTGAVASRKIERFFGITTDTEKKKSSPKSLLARKILLVFLGILGVIFAVSSENIVVSLTVAGLMFGDNVMHSLLRRSRNTNNTTYHLTVSLLKSAVWYVLFQNLASADMAYTLWAPYAFGSVLGGLAGQKTSSFIEKMIGATADAHLKSGSSGFMPWRLVTLLTTISGLFIVFSADVIFIFVLTVFAAAQQVAFSMVSRSRNRINMTYHVIASILSNGVWFLTFRQLDVGDWTPELYIPYAAGSAIGSVTGVGISMNIEKKFNIKSD